MLRIFCVGLLTMVGSARADENALVMYRDYLPEQLLALPEAERQSAVPMIYSGAANLAVSPAGGLLH